MAGRPTKITDDKADQLARLFAYGCTVREACTITGVGKSAYYARCQIDPKFAERMRLQSVRPTLQARITIVKALEHEPQLALRFLEKHDPAFQPANRITPSQRRTNHEQKASEQLAMVNTELRKMADELTASNTKEN